MARVKPRTPIARRAPASTADAIPSIPANLPKPRVIVAGEVILDRYVWGDVERISPEAPIPVLRVKRREERPGNAGFVMANLCALGARPSALSIVGADANGRTLREILSRMGVVVRGLLADSGRATIVKERMLGSVQAANRGTQQLLRVDEEDPSPLAAARERALRDRYQAELGRADGVLVSDINKGILTPSLLSAIISGARRKRVPVIIDPRLCEDFSIYQGANVLTPNRYETEQATGLKLLDRDAWRRAAEMLIEKLKLDACLITLDRDGMYLAERGGGATYIPTIPRDVYDVTGAGDVVLSVFGLFAIAGLGYSAAARIANLAASIEVTRIGTEVISRADLNEALYPRHLRFERKIVAMEEIGAELARERRAGRTIAFTNGCFDLLHAGHVQILNFARAQADRLVVGLNSDRSVRALKGTSRPIYSALDRARILAALDSVDYVVVFDEATPERLVRAIKPDVLVKGEDWRGQTVVGQSFVESRGGRVVLAPILEGRSTTVTIKRVASRPAGDAAANRGAAANR